MKIKCFWHIATVLFCLNNYLIAQQTVNTCNTMQAVKARINNDATYAAFNKAAHKIKKRTLKTKTPCNVDNSVVIPVAFHFAPGIVNCTNAQCLMQEITDQINALNEAYGDNSATVSQTVCPQAYEDDNGNSLASTGTCISFCLAQPPAGNAQGLDPTCDLPITIGEFTGSTAANGTGAPGWDGILNIFIVNESECLGVADGIPGAANGDGVSICASVFGGKQPSSGCGLDESTEFNLGITGVHEVGHYLGLYHTHWDDEYYPACEDNDINTPGPYTVNDTPIQEEAYFGCPNTCVNSCEANTYEPTANFMGYANDACMFMFTQDQARVVNYWAKQLFGNTPVKCTNPAVSSMPNACANQPCSVNTNCQYALNLSGTDASNQTYHAGNNIVSTATINANVNYKAGEFIRLESGFRTIVSSNFSVRIEGCN